MLELWTGDEKDSAQDAFCSAPEKGMEAEHMGTGGSKQVLHRNYSKDKAIECWCSSLHEECLRLSRRVSARLHTAGRCWRVFLLKVFIPGGSM